MAGDDSSSAVQLDSGEAERSPAKPRGNPLVRKDSISIEDALSRPGTVRINVQGAFIVDEAPKTATGSELGQSETKDIRLPNHHGPVSHLSIDVR